MSEVPDLETVRRALEDGPGEDEPGERLLALAEHPQSDAEVGKLEIREEVAQILLDLGYLPREAALDLKLEGDTLPAAFTKAVAGFRAEDPVASAWQSVTDPEETYLEEALVERLESLASLEGDTEFPLDTLTWGKRNSLTRSLHHRLQLLNLFGGKVEDPIGDSTQTALLALSVHTGLPPFPGLEPTTSQGSGDVQQWRTLLDMAGDLKAIAGAFLQSLGMRPITVLSQDDNAEGSEALFFVNDGSGTVRRITGKKDLKEKRFLFTDDAYLQIQIALRQWPATSFLYSDPLNQFGIALLQVLLWANGFYPGRIDGLWGETAEKALREALEFLGISTKRGFHRLKGGYEGVNAQVLIPRLLELSPETGLEGDLAAIEESPGFLQAAEKEVEPDGKKNGFFRWVLDKVRQPFREIARTGRRVYRAFRRVVRLGLRAIQKGFRWLGDQLDRLAGPVRNLVRAIGRVISGVRTFARGLRLVLSFAFRRPIGTWTDSRKGLVLSHFDLDADGVLAVIGSVPGTVLRKHSEKVRALARWSGLLMEVAVRVLKALGIFSPAGWLRFAFKVGSIVKRVIRGWEGLNPAFAC